jgi:hypothetical protein
LSPRHRAFFLHIVFSMVVENGGWLSFEKHCILACIYMT